MNQNINSTSDSVRAELECQFDRINIDPFNNCPNNQEIDMDEWEEVDPFPRYSNIVNPFPTTVSSKSSTATANTGIISDNINVCSQTSQASLTSTADPTCVPNNYTPIHPTRQRFPSSSDTIGSSSSSENASKNANDRDALYDLPLTIFEAIEFTARSNYIIDVGWIFNWQTQKRKTPLYGLITSHGEKNFFWIHLSTSVSRKVDPIYEKILRYANEELNKKVTLDLPKEAKNYDSTKNNLHNFYVGDDFEMFPKFVEGQACFARYHADRSWYRAVITQVYFDRRHRPSYQVFFVDYGNVEMCSWQEIKSTLDSHFSAPMQATCCRLYNIKPKAPYGWRDIHERLSKLTQKLLDSNLLALVMRVHSNYIIDVDLFYDYDSDPLIDNSQRQNYFVDKEQEIEVINDRVAGPRRHIADDLVREGIASYVDPNSSFFFF